MSDVLLGKDVNQLSLEELRHIATEYQTEENYMSFLTNPGDAIVGNLTLEERRLVILIRRTWEKADKFGIVNAPEKDLWDISSGLGMEPETLEEQMDRLEDVIKRFREAREGNEHTS